MIHFTQVKEVLKNINKIYNECHSKYIYIFVCLSVAGLYCNSKKVPTLSSLTAHVRNGGSSGEEDRRGPTRMRCSVTKALLSEILIP